MSDVVLYGIIASLVVVFLSPWLLYPLLVLLVPRRPTTKTPASSGSPPVAVLIPAYDEVERIASKIENTLALEYPADRVQVFVCSDGSTDGTEVAARGIDDERITVLVNEQRKGKAFTVNRLVEAAGETPLLLLTDASARLEPRALRRLVWRLDDQQIGLAYAHYVVGRGSGAVAGTEVGYWGFEHRVRANETDRDLLLGGSGAGYLIRRGLMPHLPGDLINDDWCVGAEVRLRGKRVVYESDAVASDTPTADLRGSYYRWVRIAYGNVQMLWRYRGLLLRGRLALPLVRKLIRTAGPLLLVAASLITVFGLARRLEPESLAIGVGGTLGALLLLLFAPDRGPLRLGAVRFLRLAVLAQFAYLAGLVRAFSGQGSGIWRRPTLESEMDLDTSPPIPGSVRFLKRSLDVTSGLFAVTFTAPVLALIALLVKIDSRGPVFYTQIRRCPGPDGTPAVFRTLKFRTMIANAEAKTGPVWAKKKDERITRVGRFLRRHRLDELPQFFNVLKGEMSLVGPRPERPVIADDLDRKIPGFSDRHQTVKPGITGWAQVQVGYDDSIESVDHKLAHDMVYIASLYRLSTYLKLEIKILLLTVRVVLTGKGAL